MYHEHDEKGIRCKTGAVPAAVSPSRKLAIRVVELPATFPSEDGEGRHQQPGQARRPATIPVK